MLWDHCLTFDEEYRAVWVNPNEHILWKVAYLVCRYASDTILVFTACSKSFTTISGIISLTFSRVLSGGVELSLAVCFLLYATVSL